MYKYICMPLGSTTVDGYQKTEANVGFQKKLVNGVCSLHINTPTMGYDIYLIMNCVQELVNTTNETYLCLQSACMFIYRYIHMIYVQLYIYICTYVCAFLRGQNPDVFKFDEFLNFALPLLLVKVFAAFL